MKSSVQIFTRMYFILTAHFLQFRCTLSCCCSFHLNLTMPERILNNSLAILFIFSLPEFLCKALQLSYCWFLTALPSSRTLSRKTWITYINFVAQPCLIRTFTILVKRFLRHRFLQISEFGRQRVGNWLGINRTDTCRPWSKFQASA